MDFVRRHPVRFKVATIFCVVVICSLITHLIADEGVGGFRQLLDIFLGWQILFLFVYALFTLIQSARNYSTPLLLLAAAVLSVLIIVVTLSYVTAIRYYPEHSPAREDMISKMGAGNCVSWASNGNENIVTDYLCAVMSVAENNRLLIEPAFVADVSLSQMSYETAFDMQRSVASYSITFAATQTFILLSTYAILGLKLTRETKTYPQKIKNL